MKIPILKITEPLDLGDYEERYRGSLVHVWVNPPKDVRREREAMLRSYAEFFRKIATGDVKPTLKRQRFKGLVEMFSFGLKKTDDQKRLQDVEQRTLLWFSNLWSQAKDPETHWSPEEVQTIAEQDPALYQWMIQQSVLMIDMFRVTKKK